MACGALINALWDIRARRENKPLWLLLSEMSPEELVGVVDFTHIGNALTPADALDILRRGQDGRRNGSPPSLRTGSPHTRPRPAGSATATRSSSASASKPSPTASR